MRLAFIFISLIVLAFCLYGFAATFEPMNATTQWTWRVVYGLIGSACMGQLVWAAWTRK
jgi:hypothetical protein